MVEGVEAVIEIAELTSRGLLQLPPGIADHFRTFDRFVVWADGDALHLKRITRHAVTEIVENASEGQPLSLEELNEIVHEVRGRRAR